MLLAFLVSFILAILLGPLVIKQLQKLQFGQSIREEGPASHQKKAGTPTIGGMIFLIPTLIGSLLFLNFSKELLVLFLLTFGFGLIGFLDDFIKIKFTRNLGLTSKQKLLLQLILSAIVYGVLYGMGFDTSLAIPATDMSFDLGWGYLVFFLFLAVGTSNATNLTDGLDGLLSGLSVIAFSTFALIAFVLGHHDVFIFSLTLAGALLGFLFFNSNPAKVFMGDTGSLALGGALVAVAVLTKTELYLAIIGAVFVIETLTVIIQVASYKLRKKRVFPMTPIHHSFEHIGWAEQTIVSRFWFIGVLCSVIALLLFTL